MTRLLAAKRPVADPPIVVSRLEAEPPALMWWLRWLIPATAAVIVSVTLWQGGLPPASREATSAAGPGNIVTADAPVMKADDVQIGQELVSSFDAVARLPGGEPVRFRLQQWMDRVVLRDTSQGLVVESRTPRFEIVPVGFETY